MMRSALALTLLLTGSAALHASEGRDWIVDTDRSSVSFRYLESGKEKAGAFVRFSADVDFDPSRLENTEAAFAVETASIDLDDALREGVLVTTPWFDSDAFPNASFRLTKLTPDTAAPGMYWAEGTLIIKTVEKPVRFRTEVSVMAGQARARGTFQIDRTEFRLRDVVLEAIVPVGKTVSIGFDLVARLGK